MISSILRPVNIKQKFLAPIYVNAMFMRIIMLQLFGSLSIFYNPISHGCSKIC